MKRKERLTNEEYTFFSIVKQAVFANPFSDERRAIDAKIGGLFKDTSRGTLFQKTIEEVRRRIKELEIKGRGDYTLFSGSDREMVRIAMVFDFFHFFSERFDHLIIEQIQAGDATLKVDFFDEAYSFLRKKGFFHKEILHFFALCYQLRRAYYFINSNIIGRSPCMIKFRESLWNNVFTDDIERYNRYLFNRMDDFSTLLLGETGTGKGTAARAIGWSGFIPFDEKQRCFEESFAGSLTAINLSEYSENLIESELFGHKKGAFTGAIDNHRGLLSHCSPYGSIFLDEIGEVTTPIQIKLLKVLEERSFRPVGSREILPFKGRIIAATNRTMDQIKDPQIMRRDFFYRLCSDIIIVPPLRKRIAEDRAEMDDLVSFMVSKILGKQSTDLANIIQRKIFSNLGRNYRWPGNVRELEQLIRRILMNQQCDIEKGYEVKFTGSNLTNSMEQGAIGALDLVRGYCASLYQQFGNYGKVAKITSLDRRTVKKYIDEWEERQYP